MQIEYSKKLYLSIKEIHKYISRHSHNMANKFISNLISYIQNLSLFPELGTLIPNKKGIRKLVYRNYIILYQVNYYSNKIYIIKIFNSKQDINIILKQIEKYI